ncbi:MAG: DotU family type IV/VI secretion system protein [Gemmatimonas sp.]|uniref:DotU family type IV/VI secretion system protein n=1 Tax=Gemmatimonas sp. TaxID=1962908 RepID=UPI00391FA7BF|nr:DotU family type IV/VI secretion system protein [Gemmatimonadota bacterium]
MTVSSTVAAGRLAGALQESLTAVVRLRADRQAVPDAAAFRAQILQLLARAEQDALAMGLTTQDARLAIFAVVAFLDESVLNTRVPALADWARRPLQDELFGGHMGGEWFFQHVDQLLARPDSPELTELLEVYQLCLLLGFRGKFGTGDQGQLHGYTMRVAERLGRLPRAGGDLAPHWQPPADRVDARDPWLKPLALGALGTVIVLFVLWGTYAFTLRSGTDAVRALAPASTAASR